MRAMTWKSLELIGNLVDFQPTRHRQPSSGTGPRPPSLRNLSTRRKLGARPFKRPWRQTLTASCSQVGSFTLCCPGTPGGLGWSRGSAARKKATKSCSWTKRRSTPRGSAPRMSNPTPWTPTPRQVVTSEELRSGPTTRKAGRWSKFSTSSSTRSTRTRVEHRAPPTQSVPCRCQPPFRLVLLYTELFSQRNEHWFVSLRMNYWDSQALWFGFRVLDNLCGNEPAKRFLLTVKDILFSGN